MMTIVSLYNGGDDGDGGCDDDDETDADFLVAMVARMTMAMTRTTMPMTLITIISP